MTQFFKPLLLICLTLFLFSKTSISHAGWSETTLPFTSCDQSKDHQLFDTLILDIKEMIQATNSPHPPIEKLRPLKEHLTDEIIGP